ncbi:MAG: hypothetical protein ACK458_00980 [Sphingobacteriales bacterium]|jgi:hypothetical protein
MATIFLIFAFSFHMDTMDFKVVNWEKANDLKNRKETKFVKQIEFNFASVFLLEDSCLLVKPLNPFGNSLIVNNHSLLEKWIEDKRFPVDESVNQFYEFNRNKLESLNSKNLILGKELLKMVYPEMETGLNDLSKERIDNAYVYLETNKKIKYYKFEFLVFVGDYIIRNSRIRDLRWAQLEVKQYLNPVHQLVLISMSDTSKFYNLEEKMFGKFNYASCQYYLNAVDEGRFRKENELQKIVRVF